MKNDKKEWFSFTSTEKSEKISEAIAKIDSDMLDSADEKRSELISVRERKTAKLRKILLSVGSAAACVVIAAGIYLAAPRSDKRLSTRNPEEAVSVDTPVTAPPITSQGESYLTGSFHAGTYNPPSTASPEEEAPTQTTTLPHSTDTPPQNTDGSSARSEDPPPTLKATPIVEVYYPLRTARPNLGDYRKDDNKTDYISYINALHNYESDELERKSAALDPSQYFDFYRSTAGVILSSAEDENVLYSPANTYLALSILSECANGSTRKELLELLNADDVETLRKRSKALFMSNYIDSDSNKQLLANSIWLNDNLSYNTKTVQTIAANYFAQTYSGDPDSKDYSLALQEWINNSTNNLLKDSIESIKLDSYMIIDICSTVYFKASWKNEYGVTRQGVFNSPKGEQEAEFMKLTSISPYYRGRNYGAISCDFSLGEYGGNCGKMWYILPDENVGVDEVVADGEYLEMIEKCVSPELGDWGDVKIYRIHHSVPMFDLSSDIDLIHSLEMLGLNRAFDSESADFSALTDSDNVYVSQIQNAARVRIDENGCEAAAFVIIEEAPGAAPMEEPVYEDLDFILDKPFIFVITSDVGQPLFIGVVNSVN